MPKPPPDTQQPEATGESRPPIDERLLDQARAAADQAIELAKLAQESARLAQNLNARALWQTGERLDDLPEGSVRQRSTGGETHPTAPSHAPANHFAESEVGESETGLFGVPTPSTQRTSRKSKRKTRKIDEIRRQPMTKQTVVAMPKRVKIKVEESDNERETVVAFVAGNWRSWTFSGSIIGFAMLILSLLIMEVHSEEILNTVMASFSDKMAEVEEDMPTEEPMEEPGEQQEEEIEEVVEEPEPDPELEPEPEPEPEMEEIPREQPAETEMAESEPVEINENSTAEPVSEAVAEAIKAGSRNETAKAALLAKYGGTAASESAVQYALEWFVRHQRADGSWNFNAVGASGNPGSVDNPIGATSFVLLSFLGAGQTHQSGKFKKNVRAGLDFIIRSGRTTAGLVDLSGVDNSDDDTHERFYVHGAAALALTECFAMTKDRKLKRIAQGAITTIVKSQDPAGGGWEYTPFQPGTISVTGWQTASLFGARKSGLVVPDNSFRGISHFLDSVQSHGDGSRYGYTAAKAVSSYDYTRTSIGLLCRMYLGWNQSTPDLAKGIDVVIKKGPLPENLYYTYYATQVMKQWGGPQWEKWNEVVREELVRRQESEGPAKGSWTPRNKRLESTGGGRLFATCLSTMTLEVYYRYLPLYDTIGAPDAESGKPTVANRDGNKKQTDSSSKKRDRTKKVDRDDQKQKSDK